MPGRQRRGIEAYDRYARLSAAPMTALALLMIPVLVIPLIRPVHGAVALSLLVADYVIWVLFGLDYFVRLYLAPERRAFVRGHLMDLAVVALPFLRPLRVLRAAGGLRMLQASRLAAYAGTGLSHARAILTRRGLHHVLVIVVAIMLVSSVLEVTFEAHAKGSTIHNFGDALWWSVVTVTSVGYGDKYPVTGAGRAVAVVLMITGIALFGVVTASIASYFVEQDEQEGDRRLEERLDEVLAVLHRLEARLDAAEGSASSPPRPALPPSSPFPLPSSLPEAAQGDGLRAPNP